MFVPALLTLGTGIALYASRGPVSELSKGKRYRIVMNVNPAALPAELRAGLTPTAKEDPNILNVLTQTLTAFGFADTKFKKSSYQTSPIPLYTYWFDGTWSRDEKVPGALGVSTPPWMGLSFYDTILGL